MPREIEPAMPKPTDMPVFERSMCFCDGLFDPDADLVRAPLDRRTHRVRESAWYALGLLHSGRLERAERVLSRVLDQQWDAPGRPWHGTFRRTPDEPDPPIDGRIWEHYDPNWRQFIGCVLMLALRGFELAPQLAQRIRRALARALDGEPAKRLDARYTNIALMQAWLQVEVGDELGRPEWRRAGLALAEAIVDRFATWGAFDEFNSPTYYGVDLAGCALWARFSEALAIWGERLEDALWRELFGFYHPNLHNLCGPYSRAYGMDLARYVGLVGLWVDRCCLADCRYPADDANLRHGHDLCFGPVVHTLAPPGTRPLRRTAAASQLRRLADGRIATAWLGDTAMLGGERNGRAEARAQYHPLTGHWRDGWMRLRGAVHVDAEVRGAVASVEVREDKSFALQFGGALPVLRGDAIHAGRCSLIVSGDRPVQSKGAEVWWHGPARIELRLASA